MDIYNLNPAKATRVQPARLRIRDQLPEYTGFDVNFNSRMKGLTLFGGVSMGHQISNTCQVEDPNFLRFCDQSILDIPYYKQIKLTGSYALPWALQISGTFQSYPGDARNASMDTLIAAEDPSLRVNWSVDRTIFKSLTGQTLTQSSVTVPLNAPGTKFLDRQNQLDVRLTRQLQGARRQPPGAGRRLQRAEHWRGLVRGADLRHGAGPPGVHSPRPPLPLRDAGQILVAAVDEGGGAAQLRGAAAQVGRAADHAQVELSARGPCAVERPLDAHARLERQACRRFR